MHKKTGKIDLLRYVCAHDIGMIVNPETLRHVIDRQLVYGTSRAMLEEVRFDANMVTSVDWETYPVLHIGDLPEKIDDRADRAAGGWRPRARPRWRSGSCPPRSATRCSTRPACGCAACRSRRRA